MISQSQRHPPQSTRSAPNRLIRVLLIDDEPEHTEALTADLEPTGSFEIHSENSGIMGLETARTIKPDIIVLDICMPFLDGGDVLASLERDPALRDIKVILCSSLVSHDEMSDDGYLISNGQIMMAKPVRIEQLVSCIQRRHAGLL